MRVAPLSPLLLASPAAAESRQGQEREARKACLAGDYAKGVAILSALFVDTKNPTYIFNQGRCFEQNRRYEDAIARFDEYLQTGSMNLTPDDKSAAEQHMAHSKEMLDRERATSPAPVVARPTPAVATTDAPAAESSPPEVVRTESRPTSTATGSGLRIAGIVTASAGVALVAAGVVFSLEANSLLTDMYNKVDGYSSGKASDAKLCKTLGWVGYGAGAALIATGAILYGVGLKAKGDSSAAVALLPAVGANQVGAILSGAF
jgi:hypothetical protein